MAKQFVILHGNPVDGVTVWGPFDETEDLGDIAEDLGWTNDEWWGVELFAGKPKEDSNG